MRIRIGQFEFTECWDGVLYKKLSNYPEITDWEIQNILDFIAYEERHGRLCELEGEEEILAKIREAASSERERLVPPPVIRECTACPTYGGCLTDFVCHTAPVENAKQILACGALRSAVRARNESAETLAGEPRNAARDPADYFDYVMFAWGNCQAGDRLVMERKLGRFPNERDLSAGFTPGVRFFFRYDDLIRHPAAVFDGVLPVKVKDEVVLKDWVHAIVVPAAEREAIRPCVPGELVARVFYLENDCADVWAWSEKVYEFVKTIGGRGCEKSS